MHHAAAPFLAHGKLLERIGLDLKVVAGAVAPPFYGQQAVGQPAQRGGRIEREPLFSVQKRALAADSAVERCCEGVVDDADGRDPVYGQAQRDADVRVAVHEVCCAVDGVAYEGRGWG